MRFLENCPFGEGKGRVRVWGKKKFVLSLVDQMVTAYQFEVNQPKKADTQIHTQTDRHSIALRDRIATYLLGFYGVDSKTYISFPFKRTLKQIFP